MSFVNDSLLSMKKGKIKLVEMRQLKSNIKIENNNWKKWNLKKYHAEGVIISIKYQLRNIAQSIS